MRNPHSNERYTGGSSSGSAAIVASGLCPASIGTDGGGQQKSLTSNSSVLSHENFNLTHVTQAL